MKYHMQDSAPQRENIMGGNNRQNEANYINMGYDQRGNPYSGKPQKGGRGNNHQPVFQQGNDNKYSNQIDSNNRITYNIYNHSPPPPPPPQPYNQYNNCQVQQFNTQPPINYGQPPQIQYIQPPPPPQQVIMPYIAVGNGCSHPHPSRRYHRKIGDKALLWMVILLFVFFPLFWLPLFMEECQDIEIHCQCGARLQ